MQKSKSGMRRLLAKLSTLGLEKFGFFQNYNELNYISSSRELCQSLLSLQGEAASIAIAEEILQHYSEGSLEQKRSFLLLLNEFGTDHIQLQKALNIYQEATNFHDKQVSALNIERAAEPTRRVLLRTLNTATGGTMSLIRMREDLQKLLQDLPELRSLDEDFLILLQAWFNRGFLQLRRIDWSTPASILEKLIQYESVHEIKGWPDLRRRLECDRGCFGFFHPNIPDVPLIFVEAALTKGMATNISTLLQQVVPQGEDFDVDTAVFYSINNCLQGLRGVSFGNFLIKQVIEELHSNSPYIIKYVTLSPIPGFMQWLRSSELEKILSSFASSMTKTFLLENDNNKIIQTINDNPQLRDILLGLCAHYLLHEKSRGNPRDPVARFHLGNGARLEQINMLADTSANGLKQSSSLMVNYLYDPKQLAHNHEAYAQRQEVVCSAEVRKLLKLLKNHSS
jgi:malonyl-CoA decarboxylase